MATFTHVSILTFFKLKEFHRYGPLIPVFFSVMFAPTIFYEVVYTLWWEYLLAFVGITVGLCSTVYTFFCIQVMIPLMGFYDKAVTRKYMTTTLR